MTFPDATSQIFAVASSLPVTMCVPSGENATPYTALVCPVKVCSSLPVAVSHSFTLLSALPVSTLAPSGEKATPYTAFVCPLKERITCPWVVAGVPVGVTVGVFTWTCVSDGIGVGMIGVEVGVKLVAAHCTAVLSLLAVKILLPSVRRGEPFNALLCPLRVGSKLPDTTSHSFAVPSLLPVRMFLPSGEKATLFSAAMSVNV